MTDEQAIAILERGTTIPGDGATWEQIQEATARAVSALRAGHVDTKKMVPLALEQLRGMDGRPAYWPEDGSWGIISVDKIGRWAGMPFFLGRSHGVNFEYDIEARGMEVYAYPPAHIDREAWVESRTNTGLKIGFFKNGKQIGKARISDFDGKHLNFLHDFEVEKEYRNMGIGGKILEVLISAYKIDTLYVDDDNKIGLKLYEKYGFQTTGHFLKNGKKMRQMERKILKVQTRIGPEAWKPCELCGTLNDEIICQFSKYTAYDQSTTSRYTSANFCSKCGRPLTPEAWDELEKRLGVIA